jgi:hypothetical protein
VAEPSSLSSSSICRQTSLQHFGKTFSEPVFGYADGRVDVTERVFGDNPVIRPAKDKKVVDGREIKVHLAGEFRLERFHLQIDYDVSAQLQVVEEEIDVEILVAIVMRYWLPAKANLTPSSRRNWRRCSSRDLW